MSGHSKWSTIKRAKGVTDAKRGALFTKLSKDIALAAKQGGGDPDMNFKLRLAVDKAKTNNMPLENINRAIIKATGAGEGASDLDEITYEGYGPGGGAILVHAVTDNRNRTASEVRSAFSKGGGNLGESGCVAWNFEAKGIVVVDSESNTEAEEIGLFAIEAEAEDVKIEGNSVEIYTAQNAISTVELALKQNGISITSTDISLIPKTTVMLEAKEAEQTLKLLDTLEELEDIQKAYTNADFPEEVLNKYSGE
ncbi:MAG TPA: YebC/PmpR family DNA-binding transcriptional regulator [Dehalococcoidia bacterium]|jgi:YebC/PmpR family DNA-binding regulatory protein|nr:YebC/PmpR family DNA-binding transcriptional regulator [Dehalococcoidia bacterium]|tara:strand:- start:573 stop:1331 length:759 start_codon:yes stop_codon:yes gene_type:complete